MTWYYAYDIGSVALIINTKSTTWKNVSLDINFTSFYYMTYYITNVLPEPLIMSSTSS